MHNVYVALGTNIEPRMRHLSEAIAALREHDAIKFEQASSIYETKPVGYTDQADFLNMVVKLKTNLQPQELLSFCQHVEQQLGRKRTIRFGPRSIDLDLLLFDNKTIETETLSIPHPRMHERAFVLVPLKEIKADLRFCGSTVGGWIEQLPQSDIDDVKLYDKEVLD